MASRKKTDEPARSRGRPKKDRPEPPPRKPRAKQGYLDPDMAPKSVPEIDAKAERYVAARDARMSMGLTEIEASKELLAVMQEHGFAEYEYDGKMVTVEGITKVKVRKNKDRDAESNGDDSEE